MGFTFTKSKIPAEVDQRVEHVQPSDFEPHHESVEIDFVLKFEQVYLEDLKGQDDIDEAKELLDQRSSVVKAIKFAGLRTVRHPSTMLDSKGRPRFTYVVVTASEEVLDKEADRINIDKLLKPEYKDVESDVVGYDRYDAKFRHMFQPSKYDGGFFTSLERQRTIFAKLEAPLIHQGAQLDLDSLKAEGIITDFTVLPSELEEAALMQSWVTSYLTAAPTHEVRAYLGEKIAFYFAFLDHYILWLRPLSIFSLATFTYQLVLTGQTGNWQTDNYLVPFYACIICVWSTTMLEMWKRKQAVLAFQWGCSDNAEDEPPRPEYLRHKLTKPQKGVFRQGVGFIPLVEEGAGPGAMLLQKLGNALSPRGAHAPAHAAQPTPPAAFEVERRTDEDTDDVDAVLIFPEDEYRRRVLTSLAVTLSVIAAVAVGALFTLAYKIVLVQTQPGWGSYVGSAINVVFIALADQMWSRLALSLNNWEMHRTDSDWFGALVYKTFLFRFINKNATPFYIAFVQGLGIELFGLNRKDACPNDDCLRALSDYLLVAVVISETTRNLITLIPLAMDWLRLKLSRCQARGQAKPKRGAKDSELRHSQLVEAGKAQLPLAAGVPGGDPVSRIEAEFIKSNYPGTFDEMLEMAVQFGYVTMFAVGFPISPLFCQLNNMLERKTDALKTLRMRRPRYQAASGIGTWLAVLEFLTVISVVTNMLILFFSSKVMRNALGQQLDLTNVLLIVVVIEHLLFALKLGITIGIPDTPKWVDRARERFTLKKVGLTERDVRLQTKRLKRQIREQRDSFGPGSETQDLLVV